jgi:hypothetical protein
VKRPTEHAAIRAAGQSAQALPPMEVLFDRLVHAYAVRDRAGLCLYGHMVVRGAGPSSAA